MPPSRVDPNGRPPGVHTYLRVLRMLRPQYPLFLAGTLASIGLALADTAVYVLLIPFADALYLTGDGGAVGANGSAMARVLQATVYRVVDPSGDRLAVVRSVILLLLGAFMIRSLLGFARHWVVARAEQGFTKGLRDRLYTHLIGLDTAALGRVRVGQAVSRITTEVEQLRTLVVAELTRVGTASLEFAVAIAAMLLISWKLTLAAAIVVPGVMIIWGPLVQSLRDRDWGVVGLGADLAAHVQETLASIRLVQSSSAQDREAVRFETLTDRYLGSFMEAERVRALAQPLTEALAAIGTGVLLWYGAHLVVSGELTGAEFVGFLGLSLKLYGPTRNLARFPAAAQPGIAVADRCFGLLDTESRVKDRPGAKPFDGLSHEIRFEAVGFAYTRGRPVLNDVTFTARAGTMTALVGPSGAGKTTLVDLVARFFDVDSGSISFDGVDLRDLRIADVRACIGIVSQEPMLMHDTIAANIAYARPGAPMSSIVAAARAAQAHDFILALPDAYSTVIGERGATLSGGERQRLAIARTLLQDPDIVILDEATSALDAESEREVQRALAHLLDTRTVFAIAHRFATVERADQILVFQGGRLMEGGTHADLARAGGLYSKLNALQMDTSSRT